MRLIGSIASLFSKKALNEELKSFRRKGDEYTEKKLKDRAGEGVEFVPGMDSRSLSSFNLFYKRWINQKFDTEVKKIKQYRSMAEEPEVGDVIEDAVVESAQEDLEGNILRLDIKDEELKKNSNIIDVLEDEFEELFYNRLKINSLLNDLLRTYFIDGRVYYERLIDSKKSDNGIIGIKRLPSETMDFVYDYTTGRIINYFQYLTDRMTRPDNLQVAEKQKEIVIFNPNQIGFVDYGIYGKTRNEIFGYLEKVKVPFNQLKLLETSVVIYRIIRAPERLVFKIDVGNMPRDRAIKYVEKIKHNMTKKQSYDPVTGRLTGDVDVLSILDNFYIPQGAEGRGSDVSSVGGGGNTAGFTDLNDINYFQKKLYRALKYPQSRVTAQQTGQEASILFSRSPVGEISRDEIKWAVFLERQQNRFCEEFLNLFLLHLEFKGLKKEYDLNPDKLDIKMTPPSYFRARQKQLDQQTKFENYLAMANAPEMSKSFGMKRYLDWDDDDIKANAKGLMDDKTFGFAPKEPAELGQ